MRMAVFSLAWHALRNEQTDIMAHTLWIIGQPAIIIPFVIKAYSNGVSDDDFRLLAKALTSIFLRHRVIGTRAVLTWRLNDVFKKFEGDVHAVVNHIEWMKTTTDGWWDYWNNVEFKHYLLLSGHHNESIGNNSFEAKRNTYTQLLQQQEIRNMTEQDHLWDKAKIDKRKELIVDFVMATF